MRSAVGGTDLRVRLESASRGPGCCVSLELASRGGHRQVQPASNHGASVLTHGMARHVSTRLDTSCGPIDPPAEPNTPIWPNLVNRPGLDLYAVKSQLEHTIDLSSCAVDLVGSECAEAACVGDVRKGGRRRHFATLHARAGCSNPLTSACHEPHSCL